MTVRLEFINGLIEIIHIPKSIFTKMKIPPREGLCSILILEKQ